MAIKAYAARHIQNIVPFTRHAAVKNPQPRNPSEMKILSDYEALRDDLKKLDANLAALKQRLDPAHR